MNVNRRWLYGGVFLIALGAVLLAGQGDAVDGDAIAQAARLWPVLVIALGIGLLLRRTRFGLAGGMIAAAVPGLVLGGMLVAAPVAVAEVGPACSDVQPTSLASREGSFDGAASVDLRLRCGDVTVTTGSGSTWSLEAGNGSGTAAVVEAAADRLSVASAFTGRPLGFVRGSDVWRLTLPVASRMDLAAAVEAGRGRFDLAGAELGTVELVVNAGEANADLAAATLERLTAHVNGGAAWLRLPADDFTADLTVNAGALRICAPSELGLRIRNEGTLTATTYGGLERGDSTWESPGYATAIHHADVTISANVASVDVNPMGGCK
jgi:hypothetical protein